MASRVLGPDLPRATYGSRGLPSLPRRGEGAEAVPLSPPVLGQVYMGWQKEMEVAMMSSSIIPEHRAVLGTALHHFRSAEAGIEEAFKGLFKGFEVCNLYHCL